MPSTRDPWGQILGRSAPKSCSTDLSVTEVLLCLSEPQLPLLEKVGTACGQNELRSWLSMDSGPWAECPPWGHTLL